MTPLDLEPIRVAARRALSEFEPAGPPRSEAESLGLLLSSRTKGGRYLPEYYLVYFLFVDLLGYKNMGPWEKVAWAVPVCYRGRLYSIEHAKFGVGIFAPTLEAPIRAGRAISGAPPSPQAESDATEMCAAIVRAVAIAEPYFKWRAAQAVASSQLNVQNVCTSLFDRYAFFRDRYWALDAEAERRKDERVEESTSSESGGRSLTVAFPAFALRRESVWNAQAAVDAFFGWTEHVFIQLAILRGMVPSGDEVASLANADWKTKFKAAIDLSDEKTKRHYDNLLSLREQIRNFMAHGAFGKRGEAFRFHSGAGAVPVLLTRSRRYPYAFNGKPSFDESAAIAEIEVFVEHLWSGERAPARLLIFSDLPLNLSWANDGTYAQAMGSEDQMTEFVEHLIRASDNAANMDW